MTAAFGSRKACWRLFGLFADFQEFLYRLRYFLKRAIHAFHGFVVVGRNKNSLPFLWNSTSDSAIELGRDAARARRTAITFSLSTALLYIHSVWKSQTRLQRSHLPVLAIIALSVLISLWISFEGCLLKQIDAFGLTAGLLLLPLLLDSMTGGVVLREPNYYRM